VTKNTSVAAAITAIPEYAWTPVSYPGAVRDPDTGEWISDAQVAEIRYTAFTSTSQPVTARLIVRRVKDARHPDALFPVWRYHPFSPTPMNPSTRPISPTAAMRSSKPCSPTSSTDPWPICLRVVLGRTRPGSCVRRSPTTCCAHRRARSHAAPAHRQRPRSTGPPPTPTRVAPTHPLALGAHLACSVAQHHRRKYSSTPAAPASQPPDHCPLATSPRNSPSGLGLDLGICRRASHGAWPNDWIIVETVVV
jgi:hypothetical protein